MAQLERTPADLEQIKSWEVETMRTMRETYGDQWSTKIEQVNQFLDARPEIYQRLRSTGAICHPDVVLALVERASQLRITPRGPRVQAAPTKEKKGWSTLLTG